MEIASNDGYLLQHFVARGVPVVGIEPAANVARVALERGIATEIRFFGVQTARELAERHGKPDLLLGNNVLAHVPDLNDMVAGMKLLLGAAGVITMEFPPASAGPSFHMAVKIGKFQGRTAPTTPIGSRTIIDTMSGGVGDTWS